MGREEDLYWVNCPKCGIKMEVASPRPGKKVTVVKAMRGCEGGSGNELTYVGCKCGEEDIIICWDYPYEDECEEEGEDVNRQ